MPIFRSAMLWLSGRSGIVFLLALAVRVAWVLAAPRIDPALVRDPLFGDASGYHLLALNLVKGLGLTWDGQVPTSYRAPGYPIFLALLYAVAGPNLVLVRLVQALLGALTCIPVLALARRLGGEVVATLTGLGVALYPLLIYVTGWLYTETLFILLFYVAILLFLDNLANGKSMWGIVAVSVLMALLCLTRSSVILLPLSFAIAGLLPRPNWAVLKKILVLQALVLLLVAPWAIRNSIRAGEPVFLTTDMGINLWGGNNPDADGTFKPGLAFVLPGMTEYESNRFLTQKAVAWITQNPGDFLRLAPAKLMAFLSPTTLTTSLPIGGTLVTVINLCQALFVVLAIGGAVGICREHPREGWVLIGMIVYFLMITVVFFGGTRLALPLMPALIIFAASALTQSSQFVSSRWMRRAASVR